MNWLLANITEWNLKDMVLAIFNSCTTTETIYGNWKRVVTVQDLKWSQVSTGMKQIDKTAQYSMTDKLPSICFDYLKE